MKKLICYFGVLLGVLVLSCRPDLNDPKNFSTMDSFSPGFAKTGDTVSIIGTYLNGSKIFLEGQEVTPLSITDKKISFIVSDAMPADKKLSLGLQFADGTKDSFVTPLILNHKVSTEDLLSWLKGSKLNVDDTVKGPAQLLITDFDGHGIRTANTTNNFNTTQWSNVVKVGGFQLINNNSQGLIPSPANGNYVYTQLNPEFVEAGSNGFVGELISRTELENDKITDWPRNFAVYEGSPLSLPKSNAEVANYYINFFINKNNLPKGILDIYLYNDSLIADNQYRYRVTPTTTGEGDWALVSVALNKFKQNYGFGGTNSTTKYKYLTLGSYEFANHINKIKFTYIHTDKKDEGRNTTTGVVTNPATATGQVQIFIDHVIITQGGPYLQAPSTL